MALRLYLDDSASSRLLRRLLLDAGHEVVIPADVGLTGVRDEIHFAHAVQRGLVLITKNPRDFETLYAGIEHHPGVFIVHRDNDVRRDMADRDIVNAIANLETSGLPIADAVHTLNHWRY